MKLFFYYLIHSFINQVKKMLRSKVILVILLSGLIGGVIGVLSADIADTAQQNQVAQEYASKTGFSIDSILAGASRTQALELAVFLVLMILFVWRACKAKQSGSKIFLPADAALLFGAPLKPQRVLMFRLAMHSGAFLFLGIYFCIEIPVIKDIFALNTLQAASLIETFVITIFLLSLMEVWLYLQCAVHPFLKRNLDKILYAAAAVTFGMFLIRYAAGNEEIIPAACSFFNAEWTRWIPLIGWLKGFCMYSLEGSVTLSLVCLGLLILSAVLFVAGIRHTEADFYEDALAGAEEYARKMEKAKRPEEAVRMEEKKKKHRIVRENAMRYGNGASVFFFRTLSTRFHSLTGGLLTMTMFVYLGAGVLAAVFTKLSGHSSLIPSLLVLAVLMFYRSLRNPASEDTRLPYFVMIPQPCEKKLFWSVLAGSVCALTDAAPGVILATVITKASVLSALAGLAFLLTMDFYSGSVSCFSGLAVPKDTDVSIRQFVVVFLIYFGIVPDVAVIGFGLAKGTPSPYIAAASALNILLGVIFLAMSSVILEPGEKPAVVKEEDSKADLKQAEKGYSATGFGLCAFQASAVGVSFLLSMWAEKQLPSLSEKTWFQLILSDAGMYCVGLPLFLILTQKLKRTAPEKHTVPAKQFPKMFVICIFLMYTGAILSSILLSIINLFHPIPSAAASPLKDLLAGNSVWVNFLLVAVIAPVMEEFVFRMTIIGKLKRWGGRTAVIISALCFGLIHGNFSQMIYAFLMGLMLGYLYLSTGKMKYSVILHMAVNFMGSIVAPWVLSQMDPAVMNDPMADLSKAAPFLIYLGVLALLWMIGLLMFCRSMNQIRFAKQSEDLPDTKVMHTAFFNKGMICLTLLMLGFAIYQIA